MIETYYILKSGNSYVANQDFPGTTTEDVNYAIKFRSTEKAKNYRKHCMQVNEEDWEILPFTVETNAENQIGTTITADDRDTLKTIISMKINNSEAKALMDSIQTFAAQLYKFIDSKEVIENYQSRYDHRLIDVYHYVEFNSLTDEQSKEVIKLIQTILKQRRMIKDAIQVISIIERSGIVENLYEITSQLSKLDGRVYTPRAINDLFDDLEDSENT